MRRKMLWIWKKGSCLSIPAKTISKRCTNLQRNQKFQTKAFCAGQRNGIMNNQVSNKTKQPCRVIQRTVKNHNKSIIQSYTFPFRAWAWEGFCSKPHQKMQFRTNTLVGTQCSTSPNWLYNHNKAGFPLDVLQND